MFFGNKQLRTEEKIFGELHKKLKKSESFTREIKGNKEVYTLDTINVVFNVTENKLTVEDKSGDVITDIDCAFDAFSDVQRARFTWFSNFIAVARKRMDKEQMKQATAKVKVMKQAKQQSAEVENARSSLQRIKSL